MPIICYFFLKKKQYSKRSEICRHITKNGFNFEEFQSSFIIYTPLYNMP